MAQETDAEVGLEDQDANSFIREQQENACEERPIQQEDAQQQHDFFKSILLYCTEIIFL